MERWMGKTAVVTGANGGMGSAIAVALAEAGLNVVKIDLSHDSDTVLPRVTVDSRKGSLFYRQCDITNYEALAQSFKWIDEKMGGTDVLINCAGVAINGHITCILDDPLNDEGINNIYDVNIKAMVRCTRHAVTSMRRRGIDGHIINFSSIAGHYVPWSSAFNLYTSSKYAVTAFTQSLAVELAEAGSKIKTTNVSPGLVKTPMSSSLISDFSNVVHLHPKDIADAIVYLVSTPAHMNISELTIQPTGEKRM